MPAACCFLFHKQVIMGKRMKDWLRFSVCWGHTWRGRGADIFGLTGTHQRPWDGESLEAYLTRVDVHFEFCQKLGVPFYCFHDRDICPEGSSVEETNAWMDQVADRLEAGQRATGVKLLWGTCAT